RKRGQQASEAEPYRAPSLVEKLMENIQLEEKLDPKLTLKRFLSVNSVVSTSSSFAERYQAAALSIQADFRAIGAGTCGKVFEVPGTTDIFKVANHPGESTDTLWEDYISHLTICEIWDRIGRQNIQIQVPRVRYFVGAYDKEFWDNNLKRFPKNEQLVSNTLCTERVLPLAKPIRESLINQYCKPQLVQKIKQSEPDNDCLVRVYLGKRRRSERPTMFFSLRNYNLHLDQMEELGLDTHGLASNIAEALAIVHWGAHLDADDVEFVLGSAPIRATDTAFIPTPKLSAKDLKNQKRNTSTWSTHVDNFRYRVTHLWMLDFNRCKEFSPSKSGLEQLVNAFFKNDPYYPRPLAKSQKDQQLWQAFKDSYLNASAKFKLGPHARLPQRFIDMVVEEMRMRM
ncbi:hypothetical protein BS50DRAFT_469831, partial [Corynespora cassiicola Philippines]